MTTTSHKVAEIIDNVRRVFQVVNEQSKLAEKETGVTGPQIWAIKTLAESGPISGAELARRMYLHPATIVGILDRLEARGLVMRTRSQVDRRVVEIELTAKGRELVTSAPEAAQGLLIKGLESISEERLTRIYDGLDELVQMLGAKEIPPRLLRSTELNLPRKDEE